eukprot:1501469-Amphidinium_carterae.2
MSMRLSQMQGNIRAHLLLTTDMKHPDSIKAKNVEDDFASWYSEWYDDFKQENMVYEVPIYGNNIIGDESQQEANTPRTIKTPTVPSQEELDEHNLTRLPYREWCKHCMQGKSGQQYYQKGGL